MLGTTGMLLMGGGAALLATLFEWSATAAQTPNALLVLGATVALGLAKAPRRP